MTGMNCKLSYLQLSFTSIDIISPDTQICSGLNANEIQIPHDRHHKVSSLVKSLQNTDNSVKYEYKNAK